MYLLYFVLEPSYPEDCVKMTTSDFVVTFTTTITTTYTNHILIMGNDGGSIPDRRDLVRNKPKVR